MDAPGQEIGQNRHPPGRDQGFYDIEGGPVPTDDHHASGFHTRSPDFSPSGGWTCMTYEELTNKSLVHILFPRPYLKAAMTPARMLALPGSTEAHRGMTSRRATSSSPGRVSSEPTAQSLAGR